MIPAGAKDQHRDRAKPVATRVGPTTRTGLRRGVDERSLQPEWLDELPPADPRARRSRADLRRVNAWMGNVGRIVRSLEGAPGLETPRRLVELGGGDGTLLLAVARRMAVRWPNVKAVLVDRVNLLDPRARDAFQSLGWTVQVVQVDVFDWFREPRGEAHDVVLTNLFLHHFDAGGLQRLLQEVAAGSRCFVACEPERSRLARLGARLLGLIGCNDVTRHDAVVSVRAGFRGNELSCLWPKGDRWGLHENRSGPFSHLFRASLRDVE